MICKVGDLFKYDDGKYHGIVLIKEITRNNLEAKVVWITKTNLDTRNDQFSLHFLADTVFWRKLNE